MTSFTRALLVGGGAIGVVGAGIGLVTLQRRREDAAETAFRTRLVPVDEFVASAFEHLDRATYADPFKPSPETLDETPDGKLQLGAEDTLVDREGRYFPDVVETGRDHWSVVHARTFLQAADANQDTSVTRSELADAVRAHAGSDGMLDAGERRHVLVDLGFGQLIDDWPNPIGGFDAFGGSGYADSSSVVTAGDAAAQLISHAKHSFGIDTAVEAGHDGIRIARIAAEMPRASSGHGFTSGPINSIAPALARIDVDHSGVVSQPELATWVATTYRDPLLLDGHVRREAVDSAFEELPRQQLGRIDARHDQGGFFYDTTVPRGDIDAFYGGDLAKYLDKQRGVHDAANGARWLPDPRSGEIEPIEQ